MLLIKRLHHDAHLPTRANDHAAGFDLYALEEAILPPGEWRLYRTGIAVAIPELNVGMIRPRSGLALKRGIDVLGGVIDCDYRGEIGVILINHHSEIPLHVRNGDRIAQLIVHELGTRYAVEVDELPETERGSGGFGSTGI